MMDSILFNIEAIFFPIKYRKIRENRANHLSETAAILWPIMMMSSLWDLLILTFKPELFNFYVVYYILLKVFFIPFSLLIEVGLCYLSIVLIANDSFDDKEIESTLAQYITPKILHIIPFLGVPLATLVSNINLFFCLKQKISAMKSVQIIILPILLSIFFLLISFFCLALLFVLLIGF